MYFTEKHIDELRVMHGNPVVLKLSFDWNILSGTVCAPVVVGSELI